MSTCLYGACVLVVVYAGFAVYPVYAGYAVYPVYAGYAVYAVYAGFACVQIDAEQLPKQTHELSIILPHSSLHTQSHDHHCN